MIHAGASEGQWDAAGRVVGPPSGPRAAGVRSPPMPDAARVDHNHTCPKTAPQAHVGGPILEGSPDVEINGQPAARVTDRTRCTGVSKNDLIRMGSSTVEINFLPAARKTDPTNHGGVISEGSADVEIGGAAVRATVHQLASLVNRNPNITFASSHVSGVSDDANAQQNITDAAAGNDVSRSNYQNAPGGTTSLNQDTLTAMNDLGKDYQYNVSEIAGGSHSVGSQHYGGNAFDVNTINGSGVSSTNADVAGFKQGLNDNGSTLTLGPGNAGHSTHLHGQWP